jgi:hypothetical protein
MTIEAPEMPKRRGRPPRSTAAKVDDNQREVMAEIAAATADPKWQAFTSTPINTYELYPNVPKPTMRAMELKRHYRPMGEFEIMGYNQPQITRKGPDGKEKVIQEAAFVPDVMAPSPMPGVDVKNKVWATTVIKVPVDEARTMRANGIADASIDD